VLDHIREYEAIKFHFTERPEFVRLDYPSRTQPGFRYIDGVTINVYTVYLTTLLHQNLLRRTTTASNGTDNLSICWHHT